MNVVSSDSSAAHVVIAGGGFAALEALIALRELAGDRVAITLTSPEPVFCYRPAATAEVFAEGPSRLYDLRAIATEFGATYHRVRLESVGTTSKYVRLSSGARLPYDVLVLAVGARARSTISGALTFRDQRDAPVFRRLLADVRAGEVGRLVFAQPAGFSWPVPLLELALLSRTFAAEHGQHPRITVVSPEPSPLAAFGSDVSTLVSELLEARGVRFVGSSAGESVRRDGSLELHSGERIEADRVVAVPQLRGQWITGVPTSSWGFVPTDADGRVDDLDGVYAAGDMTTFPIKQAGLATQQADRIAHHVAAAVGADVPAADPRHVLRARLLGGERPLYLRAEIDEQGQPIAASLAPGRGKEPPGDAKVFARYLTPYLEAHEPPLRPLLAPAA
jgi:sulfide:quinone oxidoreductase